jgi:hypothetical protein
MVACGDCFGFALANAKKNDIIVHARVRDPWSGKPFWHAWIERRGRVLDWQSNQGLGPGKKGWKKGDFVKAYRPAKMARYAPDDARVCMIRERTMGPWKSCKRS